MKPELTLCGCGPLPGVLAPFNTPDGLQRCDECQSYDSDLDAALALAVWVRGEAKFWQHDADRLADLEGLIDRGEVDPDVDLAEAGFEIRTYARPARADDCVLPRTDPWVELDGQPVNWAHYNRFRELLSTDNENENEGDAR